MLPPAVDARLNAVKADATHCIAPNAFSTSSLVSPGPTLAYQPSNGPWFERLCFRLAWRDGYVMRYFGRQGQVQFGADLVGSQPGGHWSIWQCKNYASTPTAAQLIGWAEHFRQTWIDQEKLPLPNQLVLCVPQPLIDTPTDVAWLKTVNRFRADYCLDLVLWDRHALDEKLRLAPDLVADLFGNASAEAFLGADVWPAVSPLQLLLFGLVEAYPPRLQRFGRALDQGLPSSTPTAPSP